MEHFKPFTNSELKSILNKRAKETKFGEHILLLPDFNDIYEQLLKLDVTYVIFGIKEDIGIFANLGNTGAYRTWDTALKFLLNTQSNAHTQPQKVAILGHLDFENYREKLSNLNPKKKKDLMKARKKVSKIDAVVTFLVSQIVKAGKIPIVIGGGHNNAYGAIKGASLALKKPLNVVNFDAHHDFRAEEGRHSGNGFSYAFSEGFLKNYFIFGLHENYTSNQIFKSLDKIKEVDYNTFEAIMVRKSLKFKTEMQRAADHVSHSSFGLEIDCDAIQNIPSSAMTPSGFSVTKTRQFVNHFAAYDQVTYLHICEAAPTMETDAQVGKLISYLITDFIRARESH
ncbi:MAG: formimidoylglutamase [Algicola sp.]|nr:formimidoylglutamase [Algicola sp.]